MHSYAVVRDFMGKAAPPGYVAGLGRGATGFTTRSDIGPAREGPGETDLSLLLLPAQPPPPTQTDEGGDDQDGLENESGLFNALPYDKDDEEADKIYAEIERRMDERRKARREKAEQEALQQYRKQRPKIQQQFRDLKRKLVTVSEEEWRNLPEVGNLTGSKQAKKEIYVPAPDSLLTRGEQYVTQLGGGDGTMTNFVEIGQARDLMLGMRLDQVSDSVEGQTTIDPKGYLTDLNSRFGPNQAEVSDLKRARELFQSVMNTNEKHAAGYIGAARIELLAGKVSKARAILAKGCESCPKSEDIWLEAAKVNPPEAAKTILSQAVEQLPQSVELWITASELEKDLAARKRVLRRALEQNQSSEKLWKRAIAAEESPEDVRALLQRATEQTPLSVELWLQLAGLQNYEAAKKTLNKALRFNRTAAEVYLAGAKLEEANGKEEMVSKVVQRGVKVLRTLLKRDDWLGQAEKCEQQHYPLTAQAIVQATAMLGVDREEDAEGIWLGEVEGALQRGQVMTARFILRHGLDVSPSVELWRRLAFLEKEHGNFDDLKLVLQQAITQCPQEELFWLMQAKETWLGRGDAEAALGILREASLQLSDNEAVWLAIIKLLSSTGRYDQAREELAKARQKAGTKRVWKKSAVLAWQHGRLEEASELIGQALKKYPNYDKLWMIKAQLEEARERRKEAVESWFSAMKQCSQSDLIFVLGAECLERQGQTIQARSVLENARKLHPRSSLVWRASVRIEKKQHPTIASYLMAKALQACPNSAQLWMDAIWMEPRAGRRTKAIEAMKHCEGEPLMCLTSARLCWEGQKIDRARVWFERAVKMNPDWGDSWVWYYYFERMIAAAGDGGPELGEKVKERCVQAEPRHGDIWPKVTKNVVNYGKSIGEMLEIALETHFINNSNEE